MSTISESQLSKILFLDIETVRLQKSYDELSDEWRALWDRKSKYARDDQSIGEFYEERAGIWAEFGKIVCISCGFFSRQNGTLEFRVKSFSGNDEKALLEDFSALLQRMPQFYLAAHNGKEFDFPYLCRRMIIQNVSLPGQLQMAGKKPWEIPHFDTLELWKFGDYKHYTSLNLLAALFNIPTPKDDIDGSMVGSVYWDENDLNRIVVYCEKDVVTLAKVFVRLEQIDNYQNFEIISADE